MEDQTTKFLWRIKLTSRASFVAILGFLRLPKLKMLVMLEMVKKGGEAFVAKHVVLGNFEVDFTGS